MADVIDSRKEKQAELINEFKGLVTQTNSLFRKQILSPLTITLGDEFQGIMANVKSATEAIIHLEESIIARKHGFKLRYVLHAGEVETPINEKRAHEMLGPGLTKARNLLNEAKKNNNRFFVMLENELQNNILTEAFTIYEDIVDQWNISKDYQILSLLIEYKDYKVVGEHLSKGR